MTDLQASEDLDAEVLRRIGPVLVAAGFSAADVRCHTAMHGFDLDVFLDLPTTIGRPLQQALAVRVLDAVGSSGRSFGDVGIHFDRPASPVPV